MKVYLHVGENPHPVYQELIRYPPVQYVNYPDNTVVSGYSQPFSYLKQSSIKKFIRSGIMFTQKHGVPIFGYVSNKNKNIDLIHAGQNLILNRKPWVVDFEHAASLLYNRRKNADNFMSRWLLKIYLSSKYCKKIMPWSIAARNSLASIIDISDIEKKIEVVYPAMHEVEFKKDTNTDNDKTNLLFVGDDFIRKGGVETLKAFSILNRKYDITLTIISHVPEYIIQEYKQFENIIIFDSLPRKLVLSKYFPESDIFVLPTHFDTFGIVFLEAMAFGVPIVTLSGFATNEIIEDGVNGFLINPYSKSKQWFGKHYLPKHILDEWNKLIKISSKKEQERIVNDIVNKVSILIEDTSLRKRMGENAVKMITSGKFSIKERNKRLKYIYEEALEN